MAEVQRYVVVNKRAKRIVPGGGPFLWDGETQWEPPVDGALMLEADALEKGFKQAEPE